MVLGHGSFICTPSISSQDLVSSKQNSMHACWGKHLAEVGTIAEVNIRGKRQPSADGGGDGKNQKENADLVFRQ